MSVSVTLQLNNDLYRRAERLARSQQLDIAELLADSIVLPEAQEDAVAPVEHQNPQIEREKAAYFSMHAELLQKYVGQYVAIYQSQLVAYAPDFATIFTQINKEYPNEFVLIRRVEHNPDPIYHFRSPKFIKES